MILERRQVSDGAEQESMGHGREGLCPGVDHERLLKEEEV